MNDDYLQQKVPAQPIEDVDDETNHSQQIFDISEDSISPATDEPPVFAAYKKPTPSQQPSVVVPPAPVSGTKPSRPYIDPNADLLDKKIGTFDATPFAPAAQTARPATPMPQTSALRQAVPTPPQKTPVPSTQQPSSQRPVASTQSPISNPPAQPITMVAPRKPAPIPIQDIPSGSPQIQKKNLQDEITAALPPQFRPQPKPQTQPQTPQSTSTSISPQPTIRQEASPVEQPQPQTSDVARPIRTYQGDVAEAMSHKKTSTASIAIAESRRREGQERIETETPSHTGRKLAMTLISLVLLGGGVVGAYYLYSISPLAPVTPVTPQQKAAPGIVPANTQAVVTIDPTLGQRALQSQIQHEISKAQAPNTIKEIVVASKNSAGMLARVSAPDMVRILDIGVPDILARSLGTSWMLGVYADDTGAKNTFVVVTSTFFQNTFAGMLQWENVMADDLKKYLFPTAPEGISNELADKDDGALPYRSTIEAIDAMLPFAASSSVATSSQQKTATSTQTSRTVAAATTTTEQTPQLKPYTTIRGKFEDRIVKNKDVRAFRTDAGTTLFLYSFIDNTHLVVTSNENTLAEILSRLEKQSFVR